MTDTLSPVRLAIVDRRSARESAVPPEADPCAIGLHDRGVRILKMRSQRADELEVDRGCEVIGSAVTDEPVLVAQDLIDRVLRLRLEPDKGPLKPANKRGRA